MFKAVCKRYRKTSDTRHPYWIVNIYTSAWGHFSPKYVPFTDRQCWCRGVLYPPKGGGTKTFRNCEIDYLPQRGGGVIGKFWNIEIEKPQKCSQKLFFFINICYKYMSKTLYLCVLRLIPTYLSHFSTFPVHFRHILSEKCAVLNAALFLS